MHMVVSPTRRCNRAICLRQSRTLFGLLAFALMTSLGQAQTPTGDETTGQLPGKTSACRLSLDFKLYRGYLIVVSGSVGGVKNLHFLLDTATSESIADQRLVERLGARQHPGTLYVPGETVSAGQAVLSDLRAGPLSVKSVSVSILDLASWEQALRTHIDMLIGLDVLGQCSFTIDYEARRIFFGEPPPLPLMVPMQSGQPLVFVTAWVARRPLRMLVNTAVPALTLHAPNDEITVRHAETDQSNVTINAAGGWLVSKRVSIRSVRLENVELGPQRASIVSERRHAFDGSLPLPGAFKVVAFDFERHVLGLRR